MGNEQMEWTAFSENGESRLILTALDEEASRVAVEVYDGQTQRTIYFVIAGSELDSLPDTFGL